LQLLNANQQWSVVYKATKSVYCISITFPLENYESVAQKDTGEVSVACGTRHLF